MLFVEKISTHAIGDNQPAEADLGNKDELGKAEDIYILDAEIKNTVGDLDDGNNAFLALLKTWDEEPSKTVNWPEGRFGIQDDNDHSNDLIPVRVGNSQTGLIFQSYRKKDNLGKNITNITVKLQQSRGDGT